MGEACELGLVSVIVPTYNRAPLLMEAVESVWQQSYRPIELIVVDDGSDDETPQALREWRSERRDDEAFEFLLLRQPNLGAPAARNRGLVESLGEFIQFLDSDDLLHSRKLERQVGVLESDPEADFVCSPSSLFNGVRDFEAPPYCGWEREHLLPEFVNELVWQTGSGLYRRRSCMRIGPWHEELARWQDWEYAVRFACLEPQVRYTPETLSLIRQHGLGRIDDLVSKPGGVRSGLIAVSSVDRSLRLTGASERVPACDMVRRYYRVATEALEEGNDELVRQALGMAASKDSCRVCRAKVRAAGLAHAFLGCAVSAWLLDTAGRIKRGIARAFRGDDGRQPPAREGAP
jgi:glycosyltransferase involved in cell wall biosynthesis